MKSSELIINADGSMYHLGVKPGEIAPLIITVGDPERVPMVSRYFDEVNIIRKNREIVTHTGRLGSKDITVISTGMGTDNIDIVLNEIDALFNIDFETREIKQDIQKLNIVRLGTSGCIHEDIELDTVIVSEWAVGYDGLMGFYEPLKTPFLLPELPELGGIRPHAHKASAYLLEKLAADITKGVTYTAAGFYAPQGRQLRANARYDDLIERLAQVKLPNNRRFTNIEMETSGLYGMGEILGHEMLSFSALLAHRIKGTFSTSAEKQVVRMIKMVLERVQGL